MPYPTPCTPCCSTPQTVNVPGIQGDPGDDGEDGVNAFTTLTAGIVAAGVGTAHNLAVTDSQWMAVGQVIVLDGPVHCIVVSTPTTTTAAVTELGYAGDVVGAIAAGAKISPAGVGNVAINTGSTTLVAGTKTVADTNVTANSIIMVTPTALGGTPGYLYVDAIVAGVSFDISSSSALDTSTVDYVIFG